jgi:hypothetical protein
MKSTTSERSSSSKARKTDDGGRGPTLPNALLQNTWAIRKLVNFTSVSQTIRLLLTCTELLSEETFRNLPLLPKVCDMTQGDSLKLYRGMVRTPESRWLEWLITKGVEELKLPRNMTDEKMLRVFGGKRFSELRTLDLTLCSRITDVGMVVVGKCTNLQSLILGGCNITDAGMVDVGKCTNLQSLNLNGCNRITDACKKAMRQSNPKLDFSAWWLIRPWRRESR